MAQLRTFPFVVPLSVAESAAIDVTNVTRMGIYVTGTFVATLQLQVSADGVAWFDEGSPLTAPGKFVIDFPRKEVRVDVTSYTSGTPEVKAVAEYGQD